VLVLALFSTGAVLIAWQIWQDAERDEPQPRTSPSPTTTSPATPAQAQPLPIRTATAFDPSGDGEENDSDAGLAIDGDLATAWTTVTYASRNLGGLKPGVGLQLKVAEAAPISGIELRLAGRGSDLQIWAARTETDPQGAPPRRPDPDDPLEGYRRLAVVRGASDLVTLRFSPAVTSDQVLIWFTALPASGGGFQGGVVEATLFS
jgi:hypothetical protein